MGFGLLLAGYFTLTFLSFAVGDYAFAFYAVGGAVSFIAAGKLYEYKHRFGITVATSLGWIALGLGAAFMLLAYGVSRSVFRKNIASCIRFAE